MLTTWLGCGWNRVLGLKFHDAWRKPSVLDGCCLVFCSFKRHIAVWRHDCRCSFHLLGLALSVTTCCHCSTFTNCRSCSFACWCWSAQNCRLLILPVPQLISFLLVLLNLSLCGVLFLEAGFMGYCPVAVVSADLLIFLRHPEHPHLGKQFEIERQSQFEIERLKIERLKVSEGHWRWFSSMQNCKTKEKQIAKAMLPICQPGFIAIRIHRHALLSLQGIELPLPSLLGSRWG